MTACFPTAPRGKRMGNTEAKPHREPANALIGWGRPLTRPATGRKTSWARPARRRYGRMPWAADPAMEGETGQTGMTQDGPGCRRPACPSTARSLEIGGPRPSWSGTEATAADNAQAAGVGGRPIEATLPPCRGAAPCRPIQWPAPAPSGGNRQQIPETWRLLTSAIPTTSVLN